MSLYISKLQILVWVALIGQCSAQDSSGDTSSIIYIILGSLMGVGTLVAIGLGYIFKNPSSSCYYKKLRCFSSLVGEDPDNQGGLPGWGATASYPQQHHYPPPQNSQAYPQADNSVVRMEGTNVDSRFVSPPSGDSPEPDDDSNKPFIMLSYERRAKDDVIKFRDELNAYGYRVWINLTNDMHTGGTDIQLISQTIDRCVVFVPVLTTLYQESEGCRKEIEYADRVKKRIVPVRVEKKYKPEGWLGFLLGNTLFHDLSNEKTYETQTQNFLEAIKDSAGEAQY